MFPSADSEPERYRGRPLVLLLENFVLDGIGKLADDEQAKMAQVVAQVFGGGADWRATLCEAFGVDAALPAQWREQWEQDREAARAQGVELHPIQFARLIVDKNFAELIEPLGP